MAGGPPERKNSMIRRGCHPVDIIAHPSGGVTCRGRNLPKKEDSGGIRENCRAERAFRPSSGVRFFSGGLTAPEIYITIFSEHRPFSAGVNKRKDAP
jgi:hypothetical protein